mgnify:CR=1 FL=1
MAETSPPLPIDKAEREQLLKLYWLEKYLFEDVHEKFERDEPIDDFDFYCIIYWKRNASKTKIQNSLKELHITPTDLLNEVRKAETDREKLRVFRRVKHIGPAIASAILAVCYPEKYTVVDTYVLSEYNEWCQKKLKEWRCLSVNSLTDEQYLEYNEWCKRLGDTWGKSLRDVDRILWTKAWKEGLKQSLGE